jgi:hypothetical protein
MEHRTLARGSNALPIEKPVVRWACSTSLKMRWLTSSVKYLNCMFWNATVFHQNFVIWDDFRDIRKEHMVEASALQQRDVQDSVIGS